MSRGRLVAIVTIPTLLLGALAGVLLLLDAADKREQLETANQAAVAFDEAHDAFREDLAEAVGREGFADAGAVGTAVQQAGDGLPELASVSEYGAEESRAYQQARQVQARTRENLEGLREAVTQAGESQEFVAAAEAALDVDPSSFLSETLLADGEPVRQSVLPPLRANLEEFGATSTPQDAGPVREEVDGALEYVISEAETLASELDAGRGYRFEYGTRYGEARAAVLQYGSAAEAELREAFDLVVGEPAEQGDAQQTAHPLIDGPASRL